MEVPKILKSSVNPQELGLTVKGILVGIIPVVIVITNMTHLNIGSDELNELADNIVVAVTAVTAAWSSVWVVWGLIRKIFVKFGWITPNS